jgi:hypothetical protein
VCPFGTRNALQGGVTGVTKPSICNGGSLCEPFKLYPSCMKKTYACWFTGMCALRTWLAKRAGFAARFASPSSIEHKDSCVPPRSGMYFTPELIEARDIYGYEIDVVGSLCEPTFNKDENVFNDGLAKRGVYVLKSGGSNSAWCKARRKTYA